MIHYYILGKSNATVSMILENLTAYPNISCTIIKNQPDDSTLPYHIDTISTSEVFHDEYPIHHTNNYLMGAMNPHNKVAIYNFFKDKYDLTIHNYHTFIPKHVYLSQTVKLGHGVMLNYGCTIAPYAIIGNLVTLNRNTSIGHHTTIGDFSTINPGVNIAGNCTIGANTIIGIGANVIDGISIGDNTIIGAGSTVTRNIPSNVVAYGSPAKVVKTIDNL